MDGNSTVRTVSGFSKSKTIFTTEYGLMPADLPFCQAAARSLRSLDTVALMARFQSPAVAGKASTATSR